MSSTASLCFRPQWGFLLCREPSTSTYCAPDPRGGTYCVSGPSYVLCSIQAPTVREASSGHKLDVGAGAPQFGNSPLPVTWEAPWGGGPEKAAKPPGRRRHGSRSRKATWEKKGLRRQRAGWKFLLPASSRALPEAVLAVRRGLVLPFTGACPRGNDVPSQTSVSSSAREGQEWSQSQRPVRGSVRAAALDLWAPRRRRPHLETCQGCRFPAHPGPLAAIPRQARRQHFKAPSRGFLTPAWVSEPPAWKQGFRSFLGVRVHL